MTEEEIVTRKDHPTLSKSLVCHFDWKQIWFSKKVSFDGKVTWFLIWPLQINNFWKIHLTVSLSLKEKL